MSKPSSLPRSGRVVVGCVTVAGGAAILHSIWKLTSQPFDWQWVVLAGLTLLSGSITVKVPSIPATISVSETFVFTAVMLFGPAAGTITVALDGLIISLWLRRKKLEGYKTLFNVAAPSVSLWCSAQVFFALAKVAPLAQAPGTPISELLLPLLAFTLVYFLLNSTLIATVIASENHCSALQVWRDNFFWLSLNFFSGASVALLLVAYQKRIDPTALVIIIPILVISYLTYKTSMGRLEDTTRHLSELNLLYLSTIETLAMWIDAKDQITHGHIRRVQIYAVELARELGVKDAKLIKAIEAAALLHDMGKLAVPEHILNKPGKLTPGEFEKMKLHASVGAQILSAIDFPYPVVPIVRHHHENWDGTGYPDRLAGMDIPIGARILAVVDCFDALTSDRPYRPKLSDEEALRMLTLRRGTMYDPLVVDSFLRVHRSVDPNAKDDGGPSRERSEAVWERVRESNALLKAETRALAVAPEEVPTLDLRREHGRSLTRLARQVVPVSLAVLFVPDDESDCLVAAHAAGDGADTVTSIKIGLGHGVSGWVATNRRPIANSEAFLDLGFEVISDGAPLRSCLSVPVLIADTLCGVVSLYSTESNRFSPQHCEMLEASVKSFVEDLGSRSQTIDTSVCDGRDDGFSLGDADLLHGELFGQRLAVIHLRVEPLTALAEVDAAPFVRVVDHTVRENLRGGDVSIRAGAYEWIVLLTQAESATARSTAGRIATALEGLREREEPPVGIVVRWGIAVSPDDGCSLDALARTARSGNQVEIRHSTTLSSAVH